MLLRTVVDLPFGENMSLSNTVKSMVSSIFVTMNSICIKKWTQKRWLLKPGTERSVIFRLLPKNFDLGLRIPKLKCLGRGTVWLQGEESGKERNGIP